MLESQFAMSPTSIKYFFQTPARGVSFKGLTHMLIHQKLNNFNPKFTSDLGSTPKGFL